MMFALLVVCALGIGGLALLIHAVVAAPQGEEDERGFRLTEPSKPLAEHSPAPLSTSDAAFFAR